MSFYEASELTNSRSWLVRGPYPRMSDRALFRHVGATDIVAKWSAWLEVQPETSRCAENGKHRRVAIDITARDDAPIRVIELVRALAVPSGVSSLF